jgi:hypothetical protein
LTSVWPRTEGGRLFAGQSEELISVLLSMLQPQGILAAESNFLWINILAVAIIGLVAVACAMALKKT